MKTSPQWVVMGGAIGEIAHCKRCGEGLRLTLPVSLTVFAAVGEAFAKDHASCPDTGRVEPTPRTPEEWIKSRDVGVSSATIWSVMTGQATPFGDSNRKSYAVPQDAGDFGRCYRLLALFPYWRERLGEVATKYPEWSRLIEHWDELTALYEMESGELTDVIKKLTA